MRKRKEDELSMFVLIQILISNLPAAVLSSMPNFNSVFALFDSSTTAIRNLNTDLTAKGLGFKIQKSDAKLKMVNNAITIANAIRALALITGDTVLANNFKFTAPKLLSLRDTTVANTATFIQLKGVELEADLVSYGITNAMLVELEDDIENYNDILSQPRQNIVDRKFINFTINNLFKECNQQLVLMDALITLLKDTNPEIYYTYFNDRQVVNTGSRKIAIRGHVYNNENAPISGASVRVADGPVTKTTALGYYEFKYLPEGVHKFIFEYPGLTPVEQYITTINGQRMDFNVTLEPIIEYARVS